MTHSKHRHIVTERLILRPFVREDAPSMFKWTSDDEVVRYLRFAKHQDIEESRRIIALWIENDNFPITSNWAIVKKESLEVIGSIGLVTVSLNDQRGEVGYALRRSEWNKGYMSEILPYVLSFGFDNMNFHRIEATHSVHNLASGKVMQKAQMEKECSILRHYYKSNQSGFQDSVLYVAFSDTYNKV